MVSLCESIKFYVYNQTCTLCSIILSSMFIHLKGDSGPIELYQILAITNYLTIIVIFIIIYLFLENSVFWNRSKKIKKKSRIF